MCINRIDSKLQLKEGGHEIHVFNTSKSIIKLSLSKKFEIGVFYVVIILINAYCNHNLPSANKAKTTSAIIKKAEVTENIKQSN